MMKFKKHLRVLWYILAVLLLLAGVAGLNLAIQSNNVKDKTAQKERQSKLNIALVNEDQNIVDGNKAYNLGSNYVNSIQRDDSQNWSVVSRGTAEQGLKKGQYQLMVVIPSDFSQKVLEANSSGASQTVVTYKINTAGNLELEKEATKKGKDIVADLNSQLVDMYMASILSNLYTAQENVSNLSEVHNGNVSNYQKNLLQSANGFPNVFPALVSASDSSLTANEALKQSLEGYTSLFSNLTDTQNSVGTSLQELIKKRAEDKITYGEFAQGIMDLGDISAQLQTSIDTIKTTQDTLSENLLKVYQENLADDPENDALVQKIDQQIADLKESLNDQKLANEDKKAEINDFVNEELRVYFDKNDISDDISLVDVLTHQKNSDLGKSTKDFMATIYGLLKSTIADLPSNDPTTLTSIGMPESDAQDLHYDVNQSLKISTAQDKKGLASDLNRVYKDYLAAKKAATSLTTPATSSTPGMQSLTIKADPSSHLIINHWTVNGIQDPTEIDPTKANDITVDYSFAPSTASTTTPTNPSQPQTETGSFTISIGGVDVMSSDVKVLDKYRQKEIAYQVKLQEVKDAYLNAQQLIDTFYPLNPSSGERFDLTSEFFNQSLKSYLSDLLTTAILDYINDSDTIASQDKLDAQLSELESNKDQLINEMKGISESNMTLTTEISDGITKLGELLSQKDKVTSGSSSVATNEEATTSGIQALNSQLESLMSSTSGVKDTAQRNTEQAQQVNSIFSNFNKEVVTAADSGKKLSTDANDLMNQFEKELADHNNFVESFKKVFDTAYKNGVPNNVLLDFLSKPVAENASSVKATVNVYRPFTWILLLEVVTLFTAYVFATQNLINKLTNRYKVNKFLETDFLTVAIISGLALIIGLVLGIVSSRSLNIASEFVPSWTLLVVLFSFLLVHAQYFLLKNFKAIGMGLSLFMIISYVYLSNAIGTVATLKGFPKYLKAVNPLSLLEMKLSSYFDNMSAGFFFLGATGIVVVLLMIANIFITLTVGKQDQDIH